MRIGFAKDIHKLIRGRKLILGGVEIPFKKGLDAFSDGDVVLHSLVDALIGAMNLGDIGALFPNSNPKYKGISSLYFLDEVNKLLKSNNLIIDYIDIFISCERPKLNEYIDLMKYNISSKLDVPVNRISIKAGTNEKLGCIGKNKAIESYCCCILKE